MNVAPSNLWQLLGDVHRRRSTDMARLTDPERVMLSPGA